MAQRYYQEQWDVESQTNRVDKHGNPVVYKVSLRQDGAYECSCPSWIFGRKTRGDCKHILFIQENRGAPTAFEGARDRAEKRVVENTEFRATLVLEGRLKGLIDNL